MNKLMTQKIYLFFCLLPFFRPLGICTWYPIINHITLGWMYLALALMAVKIFNNHWRMEKIISVFFVYQLVLLYSTLFIEKTYSADLKRMYAVPILILFLMKELQNNYVIVLETLRKIGLCMIAMAICYDATHAKATILFMGHAQLYSQIAILCIMVAVILNYTQKSFLNYLLIVMSLMLGLMAKTSIFIGVILCLLFCAVYIKKASRKNVGKRFCRYSLFLAVAINVILLFYNSSNIFSIILKRFGFEYTFNGRIFIWSNAINEVSEHWLLGRGINGLTLNMAWGSAFDYMHNEYLQELVEGGVVLLFLFIMILYLMAKTLDAIKNSNIRLFMNSIMLSYYIVMITDCTSRYFYWWIALPIIYQIGVKYSKENKWEWC